MSDAVLVSSSPLATLCFRFALILSISCEEVRSNSYLTPRNLIPIQSCCSVPVVSAFVYQSKGALLPFSGDLELNPGPVFFERERHLLEAISI